MNSGFTIGRAIDPGMKRRDKPNQDAIGSVIPEASEGKAPLLVLSDGMGGYSGGEIASHLVVDTLVSDYAAFSPKEKGYREFLLESIHKAHNAVKEYGGRDENLSRMGATVCAAVLFESSVTAANVGDSRIYLISPDGTVRQISYDHSFVMDQVRLGIITPEEARHHPRKNVLTMSINGMRDTVDPYVAEEPWGPGDHILICSDGLWGPVTEAQIGNIVSSLEPQEAAEKLVKMANLNQGPDNISVIIARNGDKAADESEDDRTDKNDLIREQKTQRAKTSLLVFAVLILLLLAAGYSAFRNIPALKAFISGPTDTPIPTETATPTATETMTPTATDTPVPTDTMTPTATETPVPTNTMTPTATDTPVPTDTMTPTATETPIPTDTMTPTATDTPVPTDTMTPTVLVMTDTPVLTDTPVPTAKLVQTNTDIPSDEYVQTSMEMPEKAPASGKTPEPIRTVTVPVTLTPTGIANAAGTTGAAVSISPDDKPLPGEGSGARGTDSIP